MFVLIAVMLAQRRPDTPVLAVTPRQLLPTTLRPPRLQASPGESKYYCIHLLHL